MKFKNRGLLGGIKGAILAVVVIGIIVSIVSGGVIDLRVG